MNSIIILGLIILIAPVLIGAYKFHHCYRYYVVICQYTTKHELSEELIFWNFETYEPKFKDYYLSGIRLKPVLIHLIGFRTTHKGYTPCVGCHKTEDSKGTMEDVFKNAYNHNKINKQNNE